MPSQYTVKSAFQSPLDEFTGSGKRPVVFDILGPDRETSLLPMDLKMVLHVNPTSMQFTYAKTIERTQTLGGFVEFHWGENPTEISFNIATGGFVRLYSGLSNVTGPTPSNDLIQPASARARSVNGTRRDTIAYDKFLDLLALFHNNGAIYDSQGNLAMQGCIRILYDGGAWWGWFDGFSVEETADKPYQFSLTTNFIVEKERFLMKSTNSILPVVPNTTLATPQTPTAPVAPPSAPQPFASPDPSVAEQQAIARDLAGL